MLRNGREEFTKVYSCASTQYMMIMTVVSKIPTEKGDFMRVLINNVVFSNPLCEIHCSFGFHLNSLSLSLSYTIEPIHFT